MDCGSRDLNPTGLVSIAATLTTISRGEGINVVVSTGREVKHAPFRSSPRIQHVRYLVHDRDVASERGKLWRSDRSGAVARSASWLSPNTRARLNDCGRVSPHRLDTG